MIFDIFQVFFNIFVIIVCYRSARDLFSSSSEDPTYRLSAIITTSFGIGLFILTIIKIIELV